MAQLTAVEWFLKQTVDRPWKEVFEEAKQMEKEHIINAYQQGTLDGYEPNYGNGEQYYNETFNN